jgi:redox-sensitive bicupin YhaK (pirin superfamily)
MTAGRGIVHSEMPASDGVQKGLQLWINLAAKDKMYATTTNPPEQPSLHCICMYCMTIAGHSTFSASANGC